MVGNWTVGNGISGDQAVGKGRFEDATNAQLGIDFQGIESLLGGSQNDTFMFEPGDRLSGIVDGGFGVDTADYSAYTAAVQITLASSDVPDFTAQTVFAPAVARMVNVDTFIGGNSANDELVGRDAINVYRGSLTIDDLPEEGDTLTVGELTYTFVKPTDADGELEIAIGLPNAYFNILTVDTQPVLGDTLTIGERIYTFVADGEVDQDLKIAIGADLSATQANIVAAINGSDEVNEPHPSTSAYPFTDENQSLFVTYIDNVATIETFAATTNGFETDVLVKDDPDLDFAFASLAAVQDNIVAAINGTDGYNTAHPLVTATAFIDNRSDFSGDVAEIATSTEMTIATSNSFDSSTLPFFASTTLRWELNGENQGKVSNFEFESFENLTGSTGNNDVFVLSPALL